MRSLVFFIFTFGATLPAVAGDIAPPLPIEDGRYTFEHKFAEHPNMKSIRLLVTIKGRHITMVNKEKSSVFPEGVIDEGTLSWHGRSGEWIIAHSPDDLKAEEAGGCSDGPEVVDLVKMIYWTC